MKLRSMLISLVILAPMVFGSGAVFAQPDTTAPVLVSAEVDGTSLVLTYDESLDTGSVPAIGDFSIGTDGAAQTVTLVGVSGTTVTLTLSPGVANGDTVTVSYTAGTNPIQDPAGNDAADLVGQAVTNNTPDTTAEEIRRAFPGVVESDPSGSVTLAKQGTGESITISLEDYTLKTPGGPRAGTFGEGARVVIKASWANNGWVAEWVLVKPAKPPHPLVGVVVGVQDSVVTVRRHNGETGSMQLPLGAELPVVGETVTIFQGLPPGADGEVEEDGAVPIAKGMVKASKVRERLQRHLAELTAEDGDLPEGKFRGNAKLVERLSQLLENHGTRHLQLLDGGLSRASGQVKAAIQRAKDRAVKGQKEARSAAERAKGKAKAAIPVSGAGGQADGAGPPDQDESVRAEPVRGKPVKVNGKDMKLWVFVYPEKGGKGKKPPKNDDGPNLYCTDGDQGMAVPNFANANPNGLSFNINDGSIPGDKAAAIEAIRGSFDAWDNVSVTGDYFTANDTGGASRPAADGNNTVGWVKIVPRNVLAAAWVWVDPNTGTVEQADVFYNAFHKWGVFTTCDAEGKFEVRNVGTHEVGHVVGLDHLSDADANATMYPSASKGEVRKQTLTDGDAAGYLAAGGG